MKKKRIRIAIIGNGDRANCYCKYALLHKDEMEVVAIVDINDRKLVEGADKYGVSKERLFKSVDEFLKFEKAHGRSCDAILNCTMDEYHYETAMPLLKAGYDMLLEKPIVNNERQLLEMKRTAKENGCFLMICHVLRYTPFYSRIKKAIMSGEIGEIVHIETSENVGVAHSSNSYIRGKWNSQEKCGSSMLLAKCCHDLDMICWLNNATVPEKVASFGGRNFIVPEKAPKGAGTRCLNDCPHVDTCIYSAKSIYVLNDKFPWYSWDCINKDYEQISREEKTESLKTFNLHGLCAYKTGSDIVDHQSVMLGFANGSTATHFMTQGAVRPSRHIRIIGTKGEIEGVLEESKFKVMTYDFDKAWYKEKTVNVKRLIDKEDHHAGGDAGIIKDFIATLRGRKVSISCTDIRDSVYGHLCVYKADASMQTGTVQTIEIKK